MPQAFIHSPIGRISVAGDGERLTAIRIGEAPLAAEPSAEPLICEALAQLGAYFDGRLTVFDLPLAAATSPRGPAHRDAIAAIGHGERASYGELARAIGSSPRAIGQACRRNPFPIVIPCHRIIGAAQAIGHYSAGEGVATKLWLLDHERRGQG